MNSLHALKIQFSVGECLLVAVAVSLSVGNEMMVF